MTQPEIVFLHGLESQMDEHGVPCGGKATFLKEHYNVVLPNLDTSQAIVVAKRCAEDPNGYGWVYPYPDYLQSFETPLRNARAAIGPNTRLVIGSSFGAAVLLRLLHEGGWSGPSLFLAGAGPKLTPYTTLPRNLRVLLIHGIHDDVVPLADSRALATTSAAADLWELEDGHRLQSILRDDTLHRAIAWCLRG